MPYLAPKTNWGAQDGVLNDDLNRIEGNTQYLADNLNSFGVGGGVADAYTATMTPAKTSLYAGMLVRIPIMADNTGASTLKVDSLQAQPILNADGTAMAAGDLKSGGIYTFVYNGSSAFILQGKGGVSATDKQALIDINNAADANNSSIKTNIANELNAVSTDNALSLSGASSWSDIVNAIPNVKTGKRWQVGTVVASTTDLTFTIPTGATTAKMYIQVTGLTFKPTRIIAISNKTTSDVFTIYSDSPDSCYPKGVTTGFIYRSSSVGQTDYMIAGDIAPASVTDTGFTLPINVNGSGLNFNWIAFE